MKRPYVLAVYNPETPEPPDGSRNPYEARNFYLVCGEAEAEAEAKRTRRMGYPVDLLYVRMSGIP